jgi:hypothetical protein
MMNKITSSEDYQPDISLSQLYLRSDESYQIQDHHQIHPPKWLQPYAIVPIVISYKCFNYIWYKSKMVWSKKILLFFLSINTFTYTSRPVEQIQRPRKRGFSFTMPPILWVFQRWRQWQWLVSSFKVLSNHTLYSGKDRFDWII